MTWYGGIRCLRKIAKTKGRRSVGSSIITMRPCIVRYCTVLVVEVIDDDILLFVEVIDDDILHSTILGTY